MQVNASVCKFAINRMLADFTSKFALVNIFKFAKNAQIHKPAIHRIAIYSSPKVLASIQLSMAPSTNRQCFAKKNDQYLTISPKSPIVEATLFDDLL